MILLILNSVFSLILSVLLRQSQALHLSSSDHAGLEARIGLLFKL